MARRSRSPHSIYEWKCDLCGAERREVSMRSMVCAALAHDRVHGLKPALTEAEAHRVLRELAVGEERWFERGA